MELKGAPGEVVTMGAVDMGDRHGGCRPTPVYATATLENPAGPCRAGAAGEPEAMDAPAVEREVEEEEVEEEVVIAMPSEAQGAGVPRTRSKRR